MSRLHFSANQLNSAFDLANKNRLNTARTNAVGYGIMKTMEPIDVVTFP